MGSRRTRSLAYFALRSAAIWHQASGSQQCEPMLRHVEGDEVALANLAQHVFL
jgi:hypothetical protein